MFKKFRTFRGNKMFRLCSHEPISALCIQSHKSNQNVHTIYPYDVSVLSFHLRLGLTALKMEAASTSETLVNFYQTTLRNNPEDSHLHTRRRENLKSHLLGCWPPFQFLYSCRVARNSAFGNFKTFTSDVKQPCTLLRHENL
jgi:hypothetical protein